MCVVSAVMDNFNQQQDWSRFLHPQPFVGYPAVSREEFDSLRKTVEELKKVLVAAKLFDEATGQKDCEMEEKTALFKKLAEFLGIDVSEVFNV